MTSKPSAARARRSVFVQFFGIFFSLAVLSACLWYLLAYLSENGANVLDDSYITYTYALNLSEGHGLRYNPADAEPTEGGTSILHILIAATGIKLGFDPLTTTRVVSIAIFFGAITALAGAVATLGRTGLGLGLAAAAVVAALTVMLPETAGHFTKGMETILFFSLHLWLAVWAMVAIARAPAFSTTSLLTGGILATLLALTRPEGVLIAAAILGLATLLAALKTGRLAPMAARTPFCAGLLFSALTGAFLIWKIWYFGDALPNSYWVKSNNKIFGETGVSLPGLSQVAYFMALRFGPLALATVALFALAGVRPRRILPYAAMALPALLVALLYTKAIHEVAGGFRYGFPMLAPLFALFALGLAIVLRRHPRAALAGCTVGLMGMTTIGTTKDSDALAWAKRPAERAVAWVGIEPTEGPLERLAHDLRDTGLRENATIYLSAAGLIPYVSRFHAVDWIGLNNNRLSGAEALSLDEVWQYIRSTQPDVIQSVVPPASPGATSRADDPAFNSPAVKDLLRGRIKLFYYWDREIVAEMLWREMIWIRDNASFAACYELKGTWTLFAYVMNASEHAPHIANTLGASPRAGCDRAKTRDDYRTDPFTGAGAIAFKQAAR